VIAWTSSRLREWPVARRLDDADALGLAGCDDYAGLCGAAARVRDAGHGSIVTYSPKVFIPLTKLCRDVCHYCTFAERPSAAGRAYLGIEEVLAIARAGAAAGCHEALFTLGDKPELRYRDARAELATLGYPSTIAYLAAAARAVLGETALLPHLNPGVLQDADFTLLRPVSISMGLMLESSADRLLEPGAPHHGSPDKSPAARLECIERAGVHAVPFTTGILVGIGETRRERIEALLALREVHERHGHVQELIIQNFRAKPGTRMAAAPEPPLAEHLWTIAVARLVFGPHMNIQAPPNLQPAALGAIIAAGINDWGGVSPVTIDHVNPQAPWPSRDALAVATAVAGKQLVPRLPIYPRHALEAPRWVDPGLQSRVLAACDGAGFARTDPWVPGAAIAWPTRPGAGVPVEVPAVRVRSEFEAALGRIRDGATPGEADVVALFHARGPEFDRVCRAADELRRAVNGDDVSYVVNRNINYTNVCYFKCQFCAFSKGRYSESLRGDPYVVEREELQRRVVEAWARGATEVCLQGGIHPDYTGAYYLDVVRAVKTAQPDMHLHAFSPLEIWQGAHTLGLSLERFLMTLKSEGLGSLPGTAAEILDDEVRAIICPDKITTAQWFEVMRTAHRAGLRTTATIMYGHVERPVHWARHLLGIRALQEKTGGFTEFVPLSFVPMEAPLYRKGRARRGPTAREAMLMHAVARLVLHPLITNVQASWVKLGTDGAAACLRAGANDLGGTLMNESISRAAGAAHGQELPPAAMDALIRALGRTPRQRTTLYGTPGAARIRAGRDTTDLAPVVNAPAVAFRRAARAATVD
jgi:FO synthase